MKEWASTIKYDYDDDDKSSDSINQSMTQSEVCSSDLLSFHGIYLTLIRAPYM